MAKCAEKAKEQKQLNQQKIKIAKTAKKQERSCKKYNRMNF